jgi:calcineurin-like phosphoesterase
MHVDVLTSGNHIWDKKDALPYLERRRLLRPANYPSRIGRGATI